jgi:cytochrome c
MRLNAATLTAVSLGLATAAALTVGAGRAWADGDAAAGQALFQQKCSICHSPDKGVTKVGPSLWGVVGRQAGTLPGYTYSDAMAHANRVWNADTLNVYLTNPRQTIPGIKMIFPGLPEATDRANVIAYLSTLK